MRMRFLGSFVLFFTNKTWSYAFTTTLHGSKIFVFVSNVYFYFIIFSINVSEDQIHNVLLYCLHIYVWFYASYMNAITYLLKRGTIYVWLYSRWITFFNSFFKRTFWSFVIFRSLIFGGNVNTHVFVYIFIIIIKKKHFLTILQITRN